MEKNVKKILLSVVCGILVLTLVIVGIRVFEFNDTDYTVTVTDKERANKGDNSKYLIFCKDKNGETIVFQNTDSILRGKLNSSDIYGQLEKGKTYTFTVVGFRIPLCSTYQNIIKVQESKDV